MNDYNFGNFVCILREKRGLTQAELAAMLDLTPAAVSKWENGESKPRVEILFRLAEILGVRPDELMAGKHLPARELDPELAEQIEKEYKRAHLVHSYSSGGVKWRRVLAWWMDFIISAIIAVAICALVQVFNSVLDILPIGIPYYALMLFGALSFPVTFTLRDVIAAGRSIGKRACGLIILDTRTGERAGGRRLFIRCLFWFVIEADFIIMLISGRTIGDYAAHTVVVSKRRFEECQLGLNKRPETEMNTSSKRNGIKIALIAIGAFITFLSLILFVIFFALNSVKQTDEYMLAYSYLIESEMFSELDADEGDVVFNSYKTRMLISHGTEPTYTAEFTFIVNGRHIMVVCHERDDAEWYVCRVCTAFE